MQPTDSSPVLSLDLSPSFNTYSSSTLAEIAARVVEEFRVESEADDDMFDFKDAEESVVDKRQEQLQNGQVNNSKEDEEEDDDDDFEFEFAFAFGERDSSLIAADDIFCNGQIRPVFPLFNRDLLLENAKFEDSKSSKPPPPRPVRLSLRKLFIEERDAPSCSSSEADDLDGIQPETYCVWRPKVAPEGESPGSCKKSNSTGSSKRWKFRDLLHRSNSEGKDSFVFLTPSRACAKEEDEKVDKSSKDTGSVKEVVAGSCDDMSVTAANHVKNRATKEGDRRRSFLPYKQDLVGLFANVRGLSRNIHPF